MRHGYRLASGALQRLIGVGKVALHGLADKGIIVRGRKRGSYTIESVPHYCQHLREQAAGRGSEAGADARALGWARRKLI